MILVNGKILRNHTANRHNYGSRQFLKVIVQVEVEALAEVIVNAWPFQWRQVDTGLRKYMYIYISGKLHCFSRWASEGGGGGGAYRLIII